MNLLYLGIFNAFTSLVSRDLKRSFVYWQVIDVITVNTKDSGTLKLNIVGQNELSSSWVIDKSSEVNQGEITYCEL